jgi:hypothetical protein
MDSGLTKFFSKLILPEGSRVYPFFPFFCKYKTICAACPNPDTRWRKLMLPLLHRGIGFIAPEMSNIQASLKGLEFSESIPVFTELKAKVPAAWKEGLKGFSSKAYLNGRDMKEYRLEIPPDKT